jgi:hypothetical protein
MKRHIRSFIIVMLFLSPLLHPSVLLSYQPNVISANTFGDKQTIGPEKDMQQIGAFQQKKNAERLAKKLQTQQVKAYIAEGKTTDNRKIYRVYIAKGEKPSESLLSSSEPKPEIIPMSDSTPIRLIIYITAMTTRKVTMRSALRLASG